MQFKLFKTFWGFDGTPLQAAQLALAAGFDGLETPAPLVTAELDQFAAVLAEHKLDFIAEICTAGSYVPDRNATPAQHLADFEAKLIHGKQLAPLFFNVMAGCDAWPLETQIDFFQRAADIAAHHDAICSFETHRGRSFFNPWVTRDVLRKVPQLLLTCDFSHWAVVSERLPDSEWDTIVEVAQHAHHIHGRIGYAQGPQVPHPAAPEYADCLASHQRCWEEIWRSLLQRGYTLSTMTPEFGPDGYLHCLPFTNAPVADLWQINCWMGTIERTHFKQFTAAL
ncbi:MAG: xylose isomerase [Verrucomicrobiaceae bacterium]|nr:xylose isomerase [Verrucomicrobiaceae bacterium]